jgi:glycosyltransferase involved in cell wall biosynthesis
VRFIIITPSLNQLAFLQRCVASVADQVAEGVEHGAGRIEVHHHVQDAQSSDGTVDWLRQYDAEVRRQMSEVRRQMSEVRCQRAEDRGQKSDVSADLRPPISDLGPGYTFSYASEPDNGMYDALNKGLAFVAGGQKTEGGGLSDLDFNDLNERSVLTTSTGNDEIVAWLNCDEQYLPGVLQKVAGWFEAHPDKNVLFGSAVVVDEGGQYICSRKAVIPFKWHVATDHLPVLSASLFVRRCVLGEEPWFDPSWKNRGDSEWILRLLNRKVSMGRSAEYFSAFCDCGSSLGMTEDSLEEQEKLAAGLSAVIRRMKPVWIVANRIRKLICGGYFQKPFQYSIYCNAEQDRTPFFVENPETRWVTRMHRGKE